MSGDIEVIADGDGIALIGAAESVEQLLMTSKLHSSDLQLSVRLSTVLRAGSTVVEAGSQIAANSGRWVKLTEESARALKLGKAMKGSSEGVSRAIATTSNGTVTKILEFTKPGSVGSVLTNPALLAGAAGIMAQIAMEQSMKEITDYLEVINEKVDDVLRAQKDGAIAPMIGVGLTIDEAMLKRQHVGYVSEVTWSSLHGAAQSIATTQAYALRQLDALAEKMEKKSDLGELAKVAGGSKKTVQDWLAVLARCFQLQDALGVLELDRVLSSTPEDVERHRAGVRAARDKRRNDIAHSTSRLMSRIDAAALSANDKVLLHPMTARRVVSSGNEVAGDLIRFHDTLGIAVERSVINSRPWRNALESAVEDVRTTAADVTERSLRAATERSAKSVNNSKERAGHLVARASTHLSSRRRGSD